MSLRYGVLGLLAEEPLHGYEVKNRFEALLGGTWEVNIGQVYTTLQRLERDGLVRPLGRRGDRGKLLYELS
ncbi:MAG: helix-turn-helix transcriptional regulator, partial [Chloroflexi bacterium]